MEMRLCAILLLKNGRDPRALPVKGRRMERSICSYYARADKPKKPTKEGDNAHGKTNRTRQTYSKHYSVGEPAYCA